MMMSLYWQHVAVDAKQEKKKVNSKEKKSAADANRVDLWQQQRRLYI